MTLTRYPLVGQLIKQSRKKRAMTQTALANLLHVHFSYISHIERGNQLPSLDRAVQLCDLLRIPPAELYERVRQEHDLAERQHQLKLLDEADGKEKKSLAHVWWA